jgi:chemotaxis response regulator CheB
MWNLFGKKEKAPSSAPPNGHRVLVVGRVPFLRHVATSLLEKRGYDVAQSPTVAAAVELAPLHRPEVILYFPVEATPEENCALKKLADPAKVLLVVPLQTPTSELRLTVDETGAVDSIGAPFREEDVATAVAKHVSASG